jgi:hypothetical protein
VIRVASVREHTRTRSDGARPCAAAPELPGEKLSDPEIRQLRLYAYLASENELPVTRGVIVRADRTCYPPSARARIWAISRHWGRTSR